MGDKNFESAMRYVSAIEGGANFNVVKGKPVLKEKSKNDTGGPTKYGITWGSLCRAYSQGIVSHADITQLTQEEARLIYKANYWTASKADRMKWGLCLVHFDAAVNSGVNGAGRLLHAALNSLGANLAEDGIVGPKTLAAIDKYPVNDIIRAYLTMRRALYKHIVERDPRQKVFRDGWMNRLNAILKGAL